MKRHYRSQLIILGTLLLCSQGCRAVSSAMGSRDAELRTGQWWAGPMPDTAPIHPGDRTAWVAVKNVSQASLSALEEQVRAAITAQGYRIIEDPDQANIQVIYTLRYVGESGGDEARGVATALGAVGGGGTGAGLAHLSGASRLATLGAGLGGALVGGTVGTLIHNYGQVIEYSYVVDVRLAQRQKGKVQRTVTGRQADRQDTATQGQPGGVQAGGARMVRVETQQQLQETSTMLWHENRLVLWARQIRLQPEEARPVLEEAMVRSLAQVLP